MTQAIIKSDRKPMNEGTTEYDCDYRLFEPIVTQMQEMGAPVTLYDLMALIEAKLTGRFISGTQDPYLAYTLIVDDNELAENLKNVEGWENKVFSLFKNLAQSKTKT